MRRIARVMRVAWVMRRIAWVLPAVAVLLSACGTGPPDGPPDGPPYGPSDAQAAATQPAVSPVPHVSTKESAKPIRSSRLTSDSDPSAAGGGPGRFPPTGHGILDGKVVLVDPGHNGGNFGAPSVINRLIWNGREYETCDTTGTETHGGYTEALFNWHVALYLTADLRAEGATVVLTRPRDRRRPGVVPGRAPITRAGRR
jgi:N-acetylmuramoyl-L-alanine amidase